jgi:hypothetical protein
MGLADYVRRRPFTYWGRQAIKDDLIRFAPNSVKPFNTPPLFKARPDPWALEKPQKPRKKPWQGNKTDLAVAGVTWVCVWLLLLRQFGGLPAAGIAIIPAGLMAMWWRWLSVLAVVGLTVYVSVWLHSHH